MVCQTVKKGEECFFMTSKGCNYNGGSCYPVVEQCSGCEKVKDFSGTKYCLSYPQPELKWKKGACNFATHVERKAKAQEKVLNALKASKRKATGRG